ncbi:hypothetical protein [Dactylosporangium sp. NPDC050588]|uniref:hypothetical protein n=1 Tax=Dactylosporangium sp. NPDC050588 TaxID=3157211 RepID=UPI0033C3D546
MSLAAVSEPPKAVASSRFFRVAYLPTYATLLFLLVLVWAGAPGHRLDFGRAWRTAAGLQVGEVVLIALAVTVAAVLLQPLQQPLVRVLEGDWPRALGGGAARWWQLRRKHALERAAELPQPPAPVSEERLRAAGVAGTRLRQRFPLPEHLVRATALGNVLAAMQDTAGRGYGLDAVVAWPRLYVVLGDAVKTVVDDRRDTMDAAARLAAVTGVATVATAGLLWGAAGRWWPLLLIPAAVCALSYLGAVRAAVAYGEAVHLAFDMHRFALYRAANVALPATREDEMDVARQLCDLWRQGLPPAFGYTSSPEAT